MRKTHYLWHIRLCAALSISPLAAAHNTLPADWCLDPASTPIVVSQFNFTPVQLQQYKDFPRPNEQCGIVDNWHWAKRMAGEYCASVSNESAQAMPFVDSPRIYNDELDHHGYRFENGLRGACVVCPAPPPAALSPERS
jgi:hypothetical protein